MIRETRNEFSSILSRDLSSDIVFQERKIESTLISIGDSSTPLANDEKYINYDKNNKQESIMFMCHDNMFLEYLDNTIIDIERIFIPAPFSLDPVESEFLYDMKNIDKGILKDK